MVTLGEVTQFVPFHVRTVPEGDYVRLIPVRQHIRWKELRRNNGEKTR